MVLEVLTQQGYVRIFVAVNWATGAEILEFPPQNVLSLASVLVSLREKSLPILGSLFSSCCRVGMVLTSVFWYFALLGNNFVYSVVFHSGLSMNFDLKSVLSMAGRVLTNWKIFLIHGSFLGVGSGFGSLQCGFKKIRFCWVGRGMRLQSFGRKILSVNVPSSCGVVLVWSSLPQSNSNWVWTLEVVRKHRLDFPFFPNGHFSCSGSAWSGIKLSSVSCVPWPGNNQCNRLKCSKKLSELPWREGGSLFP